MELGMETTGLKLMVRKCYTEVLQDEDMKVEADRHFHLDTNVPGGEYFL